MVGGAPVNEKFANAIGADAYGADAGEAVDVAKRLMKGPPLKRLICLSQSSPRVTEFD